MWRSTRDLKYVDISKANTIEEEPNISVELLVQANKKVSLLHRSRIDIMANILQAAGEGAKKTHIMYQCNLSFRQLNAYLEFVVEMGFLENKILKAENKDNSQLFKATPKGKDFIRAYHTLKALLVSQPQTILEPANL